MKNLQNDILVFQFELLTVKRKINSQIRNLPDNQNIQRISNHPNCFIINSSQIFGDKNHTLSPEYYDFRYQYSKIITKLKEISPFEIYNFLTKIIDEKQFKVYNGTNKRGESCYETVKLHDTVVEYLKELLK